jgi:transcriptional regulator with XRE-family HTH domain
MPNLGRNIRILREAAGLSREVLAVRAGISSATVARAELGHHQPSLNSLEGIAAVLGVSVAALLDNNGDEAAA